MTSTRPAYIRGVLGGDGPNEGAPLVSPPASPARRMPAAYELPAPPLDQPTQSNVSPSTPDRSQWDRILLAPDVELAVPMMEMERKVMYARSSYALRSRMEDGQAMKGPDRRGS